jgi:hypothetical protein
MSNPLANYLSYRERPNAKVLKRVYLFSNTILCSSKDKLFTAKNAS